MKKNLFILLMLFIGEMVSAQTMHQVTLRDEGNDTPCLLTQDDMAWTMKNERTGKMVTEAETSNWFMAPLSGTAVIINLQELETKGAFEPFDRLTFTISIKSTAPCCGGFTGNSGVGGFTNVGSGSNKSTLEIAGEASTVRSLDKVEKSVSSKTTFMVCKSSSQISVNSSNTKK